MRLQKTRKACVAIRDRTADVGLAERRVLILSDGHRSVDDISAALGHHVPMIIDRLTRDGYLEDADLATSASAARVDVASQPAPAAASDHNAVVQPLQADVSSRSLIAVKIYMLHMLQQQNDATSAAEASVLRSCRDRDDVVGQVLHVLLHLRAQADVALARTIAARLGEILPEAYLPQLDAVRDTLRQDHAPA